MYQIKKIILLMVFISFSSIARPTISGYFASLYIPVLDFLPRTYMWLWITIASSIGSILCGFFLAFPLGYFLQSRPLLMGLVFGISACLISFLQYPIDITYWFIPTVTIGEYLSLILSSCFFAYIGARLYRYHNAKAETQKLLKRKTIVLTRIIAFTSYFIIAIVIMLLSINTTSFHLAIAGTPLFLIAYNIVYSIRKKNNIQIMEKTEP